MNFLPKIHSIRESIKTWHSIEQHKPNYVLYIAQELTVCQKCIELFLFLVTLYFSGKLLVHSELEEC